MRRSSSKKKFIIMLFVLLIVVVTLPTIANYIFEAMREYIGIVMNMISQGT